MTADPRGQGFPRVSRLRSSKDYRRLNRVGHRTRGLGFIVLVQCVKASRAARLGVTASRRVGNAVVRNRIKRQVREWFRMRRLRFGAGLDILVIARSGVGGWPAARMRGELDRLIAPVQNELTHAER